MFAYPYFQKKNTFIFQYTTIFDVNMNKIFMFHGTTHFFDGSPVFVQVQLTVWPSGLELPPPWDPSLRCCLVQNDDDDDDDGDGDGDDDDDDDEMMMMMMTMMMMLINMMMPLTRVKGSLIINFSQHLEQIIYCPAK